MSQFQRIPGPEGMTGEQASSVYHGVYGEMPMPATDYATSTTALKSVDVVPSTPTAASNASVVTRVNQMWGYTATSGRQNYETTTPPMYVSPYSSKFQPWLMGPIVNYVLNLFLYRAGYPAATVMNGGRHNLALSTKVDQLVTRQSGGPGPAAMLPAPRFGMVQRIPRFSTMPKAYQTESAQA
jgi:hypothetical protein